VPANIELKSLGNDVFKEGGTPLLSSGSISELTDVLGQLVKGKLIVRLAKAGDILVAQGSP